MRAPLSLAFCLSLSCCAPGALPAPRYRPLRPIVIVLIDDLGYDVLESTPCTPTLDRLSRDGVTLARYYTDPVCSPTRAQIMTGLHGFHNGVGRIISQNADYQLSLSLTALPTVVPRSWRTVALGKWHLTSADDPMHPLEMGWDYYQGGLFNLNQFSSPEFASVDYYDWTEWTNGTPAQIYDYATTVTTNEAISALQSGKAHGDKLLLYVAYHAIHNPFEVAPDELVCDPNQADPNDARLSIENMLEALDTELGRLLDVALARNAYVMVLSDNGTPEPVVNGPYDPGHAKGSVYEGGTHVPAWIIGRGVERGAVLDNLVSSVDILPTVAELSGGATPPGVDGVSFAPYFKGNYAPARDYCYTEKFEPNQTPGQTNVSLWNRAVVNQEGWKLIKRFDIPFPIFELYDLNTDPLEKTNLYPPAAGMQRMMYHDLAAALDQMGV